MYPKWADKGDPRVTRVGRFIRKIRMDDTSADLWYRRKMTRQSFHFVGGKDGVVSYYL